MKPTATGSHQRVRLQREGQGLHLHATILPGTYDSATGNFTALFDIQAMGEKPVAFTREPISPTHYFDGDGQKWILIG